MYNQIRIIITLVCITVYAISSAQGSMSKKEFEELWNKADSTQKLTVKTGNVTKDLNALERENIKAIDTKQQNVTNPNYKISETKDTINRKEFSTQPILKGSGKTKTTEKVKEKTEVQTNIEPAKTDNKQKPENKTKTESKSKIETKKSFENEDFSTQPIVKGKKNKEEQNIDTPPAKKFSLDTTKDVRSFTFETIPIINKNANYTRRDEPMPKTKEQIDDEIPVNRKTNNTNVSKDKTFLKEAYAQYDKEADSMHTANKRVLDSVMKSLNIKVPVIISPLDYIDIYVNGGGVVLNSDSKLYDHISILQTGSVQREYKTKAEGVQRAEKKISRDELTKLAQYIVDMDFFEMKNDYDCADDDAACNERLKKTPQPVPLEISVTVGQKKNKIHVAFFAPKVETNWVNYPNTLEKIMNAIYTIVEK